MNTTESMQKFSQKTDVIGEKLVYVSQPYYAPESPFEGRTEELNLITAAWMRRKGRPPLSPLLLGEPGVGKNRLVYELARRTGKDLYIFQGHEDVTAEDLACAVRFSDDATRKMDYVVSPLVTAMRTGAIYFIDEIAKIRPRALALLVSVLDERQYIDSTLLGERVYAHPGFRFIAATNTADLEGQSMPEFIRSRLRPIIKVGYPPRDEVNRILKAQHARLQTDGDHLLDYFWVLWERSGMTNPPTPRDAIYTFDLALSLADFNAMGLREAIMHPGADHIRLESAVTSDGLAKEHVEQAFNELFRRSDGAQETADTHG
ncbi:MAG: hypothetical protein AMXMBFR82_46650 [Candidatus Hydrogenedentota bacterium]